MKAIFLLAIVLAITMVFSYPYRGCFVDKGNRDIKKYLGGGFDRKSCNNACGSLNYKFFALQYYGECRCGNRYGRWGKVSNNQCKTKCHANKRQICGVVKPDFLFDMVGCFKDAGNRDLKHHIGNNFTPLKCIHKCGEKNFDFAGVQYGGECWCGNSYGKHGKVALAQCNMKCHANKGFYCGGNWRNNVYETNQGRLGCFKDTGKRDLKKYFGGGFVPRTCIDKCTSHHYLFAGVQYGGECWCGNGYGKFGKVSNNQCNMRCHKDKTQTCGASWRNMIYEAAPIEGNQLLGCFGDQKRRDLTHFQGSGFYPNTCLDRCGQKNFKFAGVQYGGECWCGNSYGKYGKKPMHQCNMRCHKNKSDFCGGSWRNNVYAV